MAASRRVKFFSSGGRAFSAEKARLPQFCSYVNNFFDFFASLAKKSADRPGRPETPNSSNK